MSELTGILAEISYILIAASAVWFVLFIGALLSFTHPHPTEERIMATGTVTKIIWNRQLHTGEVRDNQTQELIPVPFSAIAAKQHKLVMPFQPGTVIQYDLILNPPGKNATSVRPLE